MTLQKWADLITNSQKNITGFNLIQVLSTLQKHCKKWWQELLTLITISLKIVHICCNHIKIKMRV